jgi:hypothetical protein
MKLKFTIAILLAALSIIGVLSYRRAAVRRDRIDSQIELVQAGMSERDVITILGKADRSQKPCLTGGKPNCDKELVYHIPLEFDSFWTVSLDSSGLVIGKFHWHSA